MLREGELDGPDYEEDGEGAEEDVAHALFLLVVAIVEYERHGIYGTVDRAMASQSLVYVFSTIYKLPSVDRLRW